MHEDKYIKQFSTAHFLTLKNTHRVRPRWWGNRADKGECFWIEPCLDIQTIRAWPWLRVTAACRLCSTDPSCSSFIAVVPDRQCAAQLLATILADIKSFPIRETGSGDGQASLLALLDDEWPGT